MGKLPTTLRRDTRDKDEEEASPSPALSPSSSSSSSPSPSSSWGTTADLASSVSTLAAVFTSAIAAGSAATRRVDAGRVRIASGALGDPRTRRSYSWKRTRVLVHRLAVDGPTDHPAEITATGGEAPLTIDNDTPLGFPLDGSPLRPCNVVLHGNVEAGEIRALPGYSTALPTTTRHCRESKDSDEIGTLPRVPQTRSNGRNRDATPRRRSSDVSRAILLGLLAMTLFWVPVPGVPMSSRHSWRAEDPLDRGDHRYDLEDGFEDTFEDAFQEKELATVEAHPSRSALDENELEIIRRSIVQGLGLQRIPDPAKANVSQAEYERAHREYLNKVQLTHDGQGSRNGRKLHVFHATAHPGNRSSRTLERSEKNDGGGNYRHSLFFPVEIPNDDDASVDHATLRLLLESHDGERISDLEVLVYLKKIASRELIVQKTIELTGSRDSRWLEFDSTVAASSWLEDRYENLGLELEFFRDGQAVQRTISAPVFNVFTASESVTGRRRKRSSPEELMSLHKGRRTKCKGESKKCCRHELTVMFKDLKGFEFIVYPKTFDAGYCKGRCPPRYNPAHHHALLQSLLWKEDRKKVPKPCCAPSKLDQLMIVYFDENDSTQLKVSYWKNIQVLECACS